MKRRPALFGMPQLLATLLVVGLAPQLASSADWSQFRGPDGSGTSDETGLPLEWSAQENIAWKTDLPGPGTSSPIVVGERIFLTYYTGYGLSEERPGDLSQLGRHLACIQRRDGKPLWSQPIPNRGPDEEFQGFQALHGFASSTPVSDGQRVYVFAGTSGVAAFDISGRPLWLQSVGTGTHNWGSATSPVLHENLVIVNASVESGALVALDKNRGNQVWRAEGIARAWNTPILVQAPDGGTELVISMQGAVVGYDPSTGKELWRCRGIDDYIVPSAIAHEGVVYAIGARQNTALAVRAGGRGDVSESHVLWRIGKGSNVSSPVYYEGHLYWISESRGVAYCVDAATGEVKYEERVSPRPDRVYASPVAADGKVYYVSREEGTFVVAARPEYELLAHNDLSPDTSVFNGTPAVSNGQLLLRSNQSLYCIGTK